MPGQLRMRRTHFEGLPRLVLPAEYSLRTFQSGDEIHWARIINDVGSLGSWTVERVRAELTEKPQFDPEGLFFAVFEGTPVATACAWRDSPHEKDIGQLHMVATETAHQGHRLGAHVSLSVIRYFQAHGFQTVYLLTDDFRLPAIKTYLFLGFEPVMADEDHPSRWKRIFEVLGSRRMENR